MGHDRTIQEHVNRLDGNAGRLPAFLLRCCAKAIILARVWSLRSFSAVGETKVLVCCPVDVTRNEVFTWLARTMLYES